MLLISCVWCLALLCHLITLDMLCVNATCLVSNYHICELCIAILLQDITYVNYAMLYCCKGIIYVNYAMPCCLAKRHICELYHPVLFFISHCICRQCLYIQLLFLCISHLTRWWQILEWKQGLQSRLCYLTKHISRWLRIAPQRRIQRQMTSPIPPEVYALTWQGYVAHIVGMVSNIAMSFDYFRHALRAC